MFNVYWSRFVQLLYWYISSPGLFTFSDVPHVYPALASGENMSTFLKNIIEKCFGNVNGICSVHTGKSIRRGSVNSQRIFNQSL